MSTSQLQFRISFAGIHIELLESSKTLLNAQLFVFPLARQNTFFIPIINFGVIVIQGLGGLGPNTSSTLLLLLCISTSFGKIDAICASSPILRIKISISKGNVES